MIGLLAATQAEAAPLVERLEATGLTQTPFRTFGFAAKGRRPRGVIIIGGMGKDAAARAVAHMVTDLEVTRVINVGICGALSAEIPVGEIRAVTRVSDGDQILAGADGPAVSFCCEGWPGLSSSRLVTVHQPVFESDRRKTLAQQAELVDMEGLAAAEACAKYGVPCCLLKGVSDLAD